MLDLLGWGGGVFAPVFPGDTMKHHSYYSSDIEYIIIF